MRTAEQLIHGRYPAHRRARHCAVAKQLSSIDHLSGGRVIVGIGVGYVEPELRAFGVSRSQRGSRTDEYLAALRVLWADAVASFAGPTVAFDAVVQRPLPPPRPAPPVVIGAQTGPAFGRVVREANGWYGWDLDLEQTAAALAGLRRAGQEHDRPAHLGPLQITVTPPDAVDRDTARRYADLGVHRLVLHPSRPDGDYSERIVADAGEQLIGRV